MGVIFDYNGEELRYACIFTWTDEDELLMVAISDVEVPTAFTLSSKFVSSCL